MRLPVAQIPAWFAAMDIDGNGMVNLTELTESEDRFEALCFLPESMFEKEFFELADGILDEDDKDGNVTLAEQNAAIEV
jgi:hypothetical protein